MSDYIIISFATNDHYAEIGKRFEENLRDLQVPYDMEYIEPCQPYHVHERFIRSNEVLQKSEECRQSKVPYMIRKLNEHRKTIIWVDCDDKLLEPPVLPSKDFDVGFLGYRNGHKTRTVMANVLAFNPTKNAKHFLKIWEYLNKWPELEASGDEHIRLCHAKHICFDVVNQAQKQLNYKEINLLDIVKVQLNGHRPESYMGKRRRVRRI